MTFVYVPSDVDYNFRHFTYTRRLALVCLCFLSVCRQHYTIKSFVVLAESKTS